MNHFAALSFRCVNSFVLQQFEWPRFPLLMKLILRRFKEGRA